LNIIFGIVLQIIGFIQLGFAGYFFYRSNKELKGLEKLTKNDMPREWGVGPELKGGDNYPEVTEKLNNYINDIKKTNKNMNFNSGIVTLFSAFATIFSGFILIFIK